MGAATVGLVLVSASAAAESQAAPPEWFTRAVLLGLLAVAAGAAVGYRGAPAMFHAVLSGLGFSGAALAARAAHLGEGDMVAYLRSPLAWSVVAFGVIGVVMYARALERGSIGPATAGMWVVEVIVPGGIGVLVLGDGVRPGWTMTALTGTVIAVLACVVLAQSPAQSSNPNTTRLPT